MMKNNTFLRTSRTQLLQNNIKFFSTSPYFLVNIINSLSKFKTIKKDNIVITFSYDEFVLRDIFVKDLQEFFNPNFHYYVLIKVRYNDDYFFMVGKQIPLSFKDSTEIKIKLGNIYDSLGVRLSYLMTEYNVKSVDYVQVIIKKFNNIIIDDFKTDIIKDNIVNIDEKKVLSVPLTNNYKILGEIVNIKINNNIITLDTDNNNFKNFTLNTTTINKDSIIFKDSTFIIREIYPYSVVVIYKDLSSNVYYKELYDKNGIFIDKFTDSIISIDSKYFQKRESDKSIIMFDNNNNIIYKENVKIKFSPINKKIFISKKDENRIIESSKIGVIDLECYFNTKLDKNLVYAAGIYSYNTNQKPIMFYIDKNTLNSDDVVLKMIDELFRDKYKGVTFYCHNLGGYDIYFIIKILLDYNNNNPDLPQFRLKYFFRKTVLLKLNIKRYNNKTKRIDSIDLCDSYPILTDSLAKLCRNFEVDTIKGDFPHNFVTEDTLFYVGNTPSINYYNNLNTEEYNFKENWSLKDEALTYLDKDLRSLYEVITTANHELFINFNICINDALTISGLSFKIFVIKFYKNNSIPLINDVKHYNLLKLGYYGGRTEVYKPYGENLYYYDVNSLYPFAALNYMPSIYSTYIEYYNNNPNIKNLFGFFYCEIERFNDDYLGILPLRSASKKGLIFPLGKWSGWYFSEELKLAQEYGYKIKVIKGYKFNKVNNVFDNYVDEIYKIKSSTKSKALRSISKLLLNSLLGRFGLNIIRPTTTIVNSEALELIVATKEILSEKSIDENYTLVSYTNRLDKELLKSLNIDLVKLIKKYPKIEESKDNYKNTSVVISAAITSYARIYMAKVMKGILNKGGNIYYTDTDSIVTDIPLENNMISPTDLGKFKLEYKIKKGYFVSNKTYCLILEDGTIIKKAKGVNKDSLKLEDYITMYKKNEIVKTNRLQSKKNISEGYVSIFEKDIEINPASYVKRNKIYDINNLWIDTKPLIINETNKDLIVYNRQLSLKTINKEINTTLSTNKNNIILPVIPSGVGIYNIKILQLSLLFMLSLVGILWYYIDTSLVLDSYIKLIKNIFINNIDNINCNNKLTINKPIFDNKLILDNKVTINDIHFKRKDLWGIFNFNKPTYPYSIKLYNICYNNTHPLINVLDNIWNSKYIILNNIVLKAQLPINIILDNYNSIINSSSLINNNNLTSTSINSDTILNSQISTQSLIDNTSSPNSPINNSNISTNSPNRPSTPEYNPISDIDTIKARRLSIYSQTREQISLIERLLDSLITKRNSPTVLFDSNVTQMSVDIDINNYKAELQSIKDKYGVMSPSKNNSQLLISLKENIRSLNSNMNSTRIMLDEARISLNK